MAATKYQIFFRYINPRSGIAITNDLSHDYEEVVDIVYQGHKLYAGDNDEQLEAEEERNEMLVNGNSPTLCDKYDMMFAFGGAKKYYHKKWISKSSNASTGVGHYEEMRNMSNGTITEVSATDETAVASEGAITNIIKQRTKKAKGGEAKLDSDGNDTGETYKEGDEIPLTNDFERNLEGELTSLNEAAGVSADAASKSYTLIEEGMYPYVVKDYYIRIPMSPWIKGSCYGSLEAAIQKCKSLVNAIGIANVKLVKLVEIRQKIRII